MVTGFQNIGAISLSIDYDYSVMQFTGGTPHPQLPGFPIGDLNLASGYHRLSMGWFGQGVTLPDGSAIMTLNFSFTGGISTLNFYDNGPSCEYADGNYNTLNDIPFGDFYVNGHVCGVIGTPGPISGSTAVCQGQTGVVYSIEPLANATAYSWLLPPGATITAGQNTNVIMVDFSPNAASGFVEATGLNACGAGTASILPVTVDPIPLPDAGDDFSIPYGTTTSLSVDPGIAGNFSYSWEPASLLIDPSVQNPITIQLTETTLFTVMVTNQATGCFAGDDIIVNVTGGPLAASPLAIPSIVCQGTPAQLISNAGGGSGDYTYLWTADPPGNPAWTSTLANPVVLPEVSTTFNLVVHDGFNFTTGSTYLTVLELPTATITGGDTLCGENEWTTLQVELTGTPPWSLIYTFGSTSVLVTNQQTSPFLITTTQPGDYVISSVEDANCYGLTFGTAIVRKYPIPEKPEITTYFMELISSSCCGNQWYLNGNPIAGATNQTYQVSVSGLYHVVVTMNSCSSEPSDPVDIIVGIPEPVPETIAIFPNPAKDRVYVQFTPRKDEEFMLNLYSADGRLLKSQPGRAEPGVNHAEIPLSDFPPGLYLIRLSLSGSSSVFRFILQ